MHSLTAKLMTSDFAEKLAVDSKSISEKEGVKADTEATLGKHNEEPKFQKKEALPTLHVIEKIMGRRVTLVVYEDNSQVVAAVKNGYSPALRHLTRTQRISVASINEVFYAGCEPRRGYSLLQCPTAEQKADIFTKCLARADFIRLKGMIGIRSPKTLTTTSVCQSLGGPPGTPPGISGAHVEGGVVTMRSSRIAEQVRGRTPRPPSEVAVQLCARD